MAVSNKHWKDHLELLDCPYTEGMSHEEVSQLLLKESEQRLDILEWLLLLFQPRLSKILDPAVRKDGKIIKSKEERILNAVIALAMCRAEDVDLIKGVAAVNKQKMFINTLLDLVIAEDSGQVISLRDASLYIDRLADEGIFVPTDDKISLLPKDLKAEVESLCSGTDQQPSLEQLRVNYQECINEVETLEAELSELQKKTSIPPPGQQKEVPAMNQMLSSSIQDLDQLASGFLHSYESHLGAWCHGLQPELNDLGPSARRVHTQLKKFVSFLEDVNKLRQLRCNLEDDIKEKHTRKLVEASAMASDSSTSDSIQRCLGILEESMHRTQSGFMSRYSTLLHL